MKSYDFLLIAGVSCLAVGILPPFFRKTSTIQWECDKYREEIARVAREQKSVDEFNRTNKNPNLVGMVTRNLIFNWHPQNGDREIGYRSDGVVVWRELPEGKDTK